MHPEIVTFGETMVLLLAEQVGPLREAASFSRHVAGAEANVALGVCRLGHTAAWMGRVGDDEFGRAILYRLRGEGIDVTHVRVDAEAPTGLLVRERREVGPLDVAYYRRGSAASRMSPEDLDEDYIRQAKALHLTGITPALSSSCKATVFGAAEIAHAANVPVVLDPNLRLKLWSKEEARATLRDLVRLTDVLLPGADEAELLTGESDPEVAARALLELGPELVVVKVGAKGCIAVTSSDMVLSPAMPLARVVDPVGAGDAFAAGFHVGRLREFDLPRTLWLANRCGALAMSVPGDTEGFPRWDEAYDESLADIRR